MTLIDLPNFSKISQKCLDVFTSTYGTEVFSYRQIRSTSNSYLLELTMKNADKHERLVVATQDELPESINLSEYNCYFDETPVSNPSKTIQVVQFNKVYEYLDNKCYGFNPEFINTTPKN